MDSTSASKMPSILMAFFPFPSANGEHKRHSRRTWRSSPSSPPRPERRRPRRERAGRSRTAHAHGGGSGGVQARRGDVLQESELHATGTARGSTEASPRGTG